VTQRTGASDTITKERGNLEEGSCSPRTGKIRRDGKNKTAGVVHNTPQAAQKRKKAVEGSLTQERGKSDVKGEGFHLPKTDLGSKTIGRSGAP